ncbi:MAG: 30S ribosomal protein S20 [Elusimicrobia bacterium]|nr:30S ribosomal protein S20 [Elusimicrobiota bacterium]
MAKLKTGRHTSALKAVRQAHRRMLRNRAVKRNIRGAAKEFYEAVAGKDKGNSQKFFNTAASQWDKASKSGAIHWKAAARKKSRMARAANKLAAA